MIDPLDLFDNVVDLLPAGLEIEHRARVDQVAALQADSYRRLTGTQELRSGNAFEGT